MHRHTLFIPTFLHRLIILQYFESSESQPNRKDNIYPKSIQIQQISKPEGGVQITAGVNSFWKKPSLVHLELGSERDLCVKKPWSFKKYENNSPNINIIF